MKKVDYNKYDSFLSSEVINKSDGVYIDNIRIITHDQSDVMARYASNVVDGRKNISILEVGYGLGVFSDEIEKYDLKKHCIVECHPQLIENAECKYKNKKHVEVFCGFWQDYTPNILFDAVFYDVTVLDQDAVDSLISFLKWIDKYLNIGGIVSFWYCGRKIDRRILDYLYSSLYIYHISIYENKRHYIMFYIKKEKNNIDQGVNV